MVELGRGHLLPAARAARRRCRTASPRRRRLSRRRRRRRAAARPATWAGAVRAGSSRCGEPPRWRSKPVEVWRASGRAAGSPACRPWRRSGRARPGAGRASADRAEIRSNSTARGCSMAWPPAGPPRARRGLQYPLGKVNRALGLGRHAERAQGRAGDRDALSEPTCRRGRDRQQRDRGAGGRGARPDRPARLQLPGRRDRAARGGVPADPRRERGRGSDARHQDARRTWARRVA